jgi:hypothetical protein
MYVLMINLHISNFFTAAEHFFTVLEILLITRGIYLHFSTLTRPFFICLFCGVCVRCEWTRDLTATCHKPDRHRSVGVGQTTSEVDSSCYV